MLRWRLISSAAILAVLLSLLALDYQRVLFHVGGVWLFPVVCLLAVGASAEMLVLMRSKGHSVIAWPVYGGALLVVVAASAPLAWELAGATYPPDCPLGKLGWPLAALAAGVMLPLAAEMLRFREPGEATVNAALGAFAITYIGSLAAFIVALRLFYDNNKWGIAALVSVVFVVKMSDTGAYTFGRLLGRHKLTPLLSPKKTVEGALGGIVTACAASTLYFWLIAPMMTDGMVHGLWWGWLLYGLILALAGMAGDLAMSLMKRDAGRKDSSDWLPGLGGVLDVLDSLLVAAPPAFLCWAAGIVGPLAS